MSKSSIVAAHAVGLLVLLCALPAGAATTEGDAAPHARQRSHRTPGGTAKKREVEHQPGSRSAQADANASASASSEGGVGMASQGQSLTVDNHARGAVSSAVAPALTGSNDTCMGSASVGAMGVAFGLSFGTTYTDDNCMMLKNSRELWNMGFRGAAVARMCMDERNRQALESSGVSCPAAAGESEPQRRDTSIRDAVSSNAQPVRFVR